MPIALLLSLFLLTINSLTAQQIAKPIDEKALNPYAEEAWCIYKVKHQKAQTRLWVENINPAAYTLVYRTYTTAKSRKPATSELIEVSLREANSQFSFEIKVPAEVFWLEIEIKNTINQQSIRDIILVNRQQENDQVLRVFDKDSMLILQNYIYKNQSFLLKTRGEKDKKLYIKYFNPQLKPAANPYGKADQGFDPIASKSDADLEANTNTWLHFEQEGIYFIQLDKESNKGVFLHCVPDDYPQMTKVSELCQSLYYLADKKEYQELLSQLDKKSLDAFWLKISEGNPEKAKKLIRDYYNRIQTANKLFTADKIGWQSDRGMLYLLMGLPSAVYKQGNREIWWYRQDKGMTAIEFSFLKKAEQYTLQRAERYFQPWKKAMTRWRKMP